MSKKKITKGYKVTDANMQCRGFQFELNKPFIHEGEISVCSTGFHFCEQISDCFSYYTFDSSNRVFEVEAYGELKSSEDKHACSEIKFINELTWIEVLQLVNTGKDNTGRSNSGNWNSGNWNSGDSNSGYRNSGYRNSGYRNSGDSNSGDSNSGNSNSGYRNSGNWNSGDRNSGDSNSGYRNSGAFCTDKNPVLILFNKPSKMSIKEWENTEACNMMNNINPTIWVPQLIMTDEEKKTHPKYETTEGYLKPISMKEAWANFWHNLSERKKKLFTELENFDAIIFEEITGIKI